MPHLGACNGHGRRRPASDLQHVPEVLGGGARGPPRREGADSVERKGARQRGRAGAACPRCPGGGAAPSGGGNASPCCGPWGLWVPEPLGVPHLLSSGPFLSDPKMSIWGVAL